jgi:hypothetical protein
MSRLSRYNKADELEIIQEMLDALPPPLFQCVRSIWCDSKAMWCLSGCITPWNVDDAKAIAGIFELVAIRRHGGHNGIFINDTSVSGDDRHIELDPYWAEDWD